MASGTSDCDFTRTKELRRLVDICLTCRSSRFIGKIPPSRHMRLKIDFEMDRTEIQTTTIREQAASLLHPGCTKLIPSTPFYETQKLPHRRVFTLTLFSRPQNSFDKATFEVVSALIQTRGLLFFHSGHTRLIASASELGEHFKLAMEIRPGRSPTKSSRRSMTMFLSRA